MNVQYNHILEWEVGFLANSSVQFSRSVVSDSLRPHESQHARPPCPSPTPGVYSNSCPSSQWCHPAISSSVVPFSSYPQSLPASGSFPMSQPFAWGGQSTGVSASASALPMNTQDWSPLGWTGWISLQTVDQNFFCWHYPMTQLKVQNSLVGKEIVTSFCSQFSLIWMYLLEESGILPTLWEFMILLSRK